MFFLKKKRKEKRKYESNGKENFELLAQWKHSCKREKTILKQTRAKHMLTSGHPNWFFPFSNPDGWEVGIFPRVLSLSLSNWAVKVVRANSVTSVAWYSFYFFATFWSKRWATAVFGRRLGYFCHNFIIPIKTIIVDKIFRKSLVGLKKKKEKRLLVMVDSTRSFSSDNFGEKIT